MRRLVLKTLLLLPLLIAPLVAGIVSSSAGVTVLATPPTSVQLDQLDSNNVVFAFQEQQSFVLPVALAVDATLPGSYDTTADLTPGVIPAGTQVNSYLIHSDPDLPLTPFTLVAYLQRAVRFGEPIIGLMFLANTLRAADGIVGAPGTLYPPLPIFSGLELDPTDGPIIWSIDGRTLTVNLWTGTGLDGGGVDQIRVLTAIPEPWTAGLAGAGLLALLALARRRR